MYESPNDLYTNCKVMAQCTHAKAPHDNQDIKCCPVRLEITIIVCGVIILDQRNSADDDNYWRPVA